MTAVFDRPKPALNSPVLLDSVPTGLAPDDLAALVRRVACGVDRWLLSWLPGHNTDLHDHGNSAAAFTVVRGSLSEVRIDASGERRVHVRATGSATSLGAGVIHDVTGAGTEPAVSIHAYSPPLTAMNYIDPATLRIVRTVQSNEPEEELPR